MTAIAAISAQMLSTDRFPIMLLEFVVPLALTPAAPGELATAGPVRLPETPLIVGNSVKFILLLPVVADLVNPVLLWLLELAAEAAIPSTSTTPPDATVTE